jgi:hypothetical protein
LDKVWGDTVGDNNDDSETLTLEEALKKILNNCAISEWRSLRIGLILALLLMVTPCLALDTLILRGVGQVEDSYIQTKNHAKDNIDATISPFTNYGKDHDLFLKLGLPDQGLYHNDTARICIKPVFTFPHPESVHVISATLTLDFTPVVSFDAYQGGTINAYALDSVWEEGVSHEGHMDSGVSWMCGIQPAYPVPNVALDSANWDWGDNGNTPLKNQGNCGSCQAFGLFAAIEAAYKINISHDNSHVFSELQVTRCVYRDNDSVYACHGGYAWDVATDMLYFGRMGKGLIADSLLPYDGSGEELYGVCSDTVGNPSPPPDSITIETPCAACPDSSLYQPRTALKWWWPVKSDSVIHVKQAIKYNPIASFQGEGSGHVIANTGYTATQVKQKNSQYPGSYAWRTIGTGAGNIDITSTNVANSTVLPSFTAEPKYWDRGGSYSNNLIGTMEGATSGSSTITLDAETVESWIKGTNNGLILIPEDSVFLDFLSTDGDTSYYDSMEEIYYYASHPTFTIVYTTTTADAVAPNGRRRRLQQIGSIDTTNICQYKE